MAELGVTILLRTDDSEGTLAVIRGASVRRLLARRSLALAVFVLRERHSENISIP
jgi:hypothetical protein